MKYQTKMGLYEEVKAPYGEHLEAGDIIVGELSAVAKRVPLMEGPDEDGETIDQWVIEKRQPVSSGWQAKGGIWVLRKVAHTENEFGMEMP